MVTVCWDCPARDGGFWMALPNEQLGHVHRAVPIQHDADAYLLPAGVEYVAPVTIAAHQSGVGFNYSGMLRYVFAHAVKGVAVVAQHGSGIAQRRGGMGKVIVG